ncbi:MAG: ATP-dependent protease ATPase subunit HslU [Chthonomonas sp.]|nr:ATP-dependent protease ATPase subunit HslU [Chthonomonas sp.]
MTTMPLPIEALTPTQIVAELDRYIVGQAAAKRAVAVALRNRYRRQNLPAAEREDVLPKNILMSGPTGVGKTEIARRLAQLARAPFIKVEATKFTEIGYVGRDVESMIRDLVGAAYRLVENERMTEVAAEARQRALERIAESIEDEVYPNLADYSYNPETNQEPVSFEERERLRAELVAAIDRGEHRERMTEIETDDGGQNFLQVFTPGGMEEMGLDMAALNPSLGNNRRSYQRMSVAEALEVLVDQEARSLVGKSSLARDAIARTEQTGIIFLDEIDKVGGKSGGSGPDVSREGVQRDLLPIIEGSTVPTKYGPVRTDHILFIAAGAFTISKVSDLIPELQGRLPIRVELETLREDDFKKILTEPKNALTKQYTKLLAVDGITIEFTDDALDEIAHVAWEVNSKVENIGARRLHTVLEKLLEEIAFAAPEVEEKSVRFDCAKVREILGPIMRNLDQTRAML